VYINVQKTVRNTSADSWNLLVRKESKDVKTS